MVIIRYDNIWYVNIHDIDMKCAYLYPPSSGNIFRTAVVPLLWPPQGESQQRGRVRRCHQHSEETTCVAAQGVGFGAIQNPQRYENWWVRIVGKIWSSLKLYGNWNSLAKKGQHIWSYLITASLREFLCAFNWSILKPWFWWTASLLPRVGVLDEVFPFCTGSIRPDFTWISFDFCETYVQTSTWSFIGHDVFLAYSLSPDFVAFWHYLIEILRNWHFSYTYYHIPQHSKDMTLSLTFDPRHDVVIWPRWTTPFLQVLALMKKKCQNPCSWEVNMKQIFFRQTITR